MDKDLVVFFLTSRHTQHKIAIDTLREVKKKHNRDFVTIDITDQTIDIVGKTAIVRHQFNATTNDGGKPGIVKLKVLLIFQKENGVWKLLARQAVKA